MNTIYFGKCLELQSIIKTYEELVFKHHQDRAKVQAINLEYILLLNNPNFNWSDQSEALQESYINAPEVFGNSVDLDSIIKNRHTPQLQTERSKE